MFAEIAIAFTHSYMLDSVFDSDIRICLWTTTTLENDWDGGISCSFVMATWTCEVDVPDSTAAEADFLGRRV